ncbi:MAG: PDC sensor domain-containing protein [Proteobacteria bacterium]|nr:PDC sensor domain-containing protein [Pseudomonadota bacterium]MBU1418041.1 PDC sensor domain-containing protein [Pseudomonadota bacterium]MBU1456327.1 PDC sensor domain-containing protein [Pseudomonadota bacterium]
MRKFLTLAVISLFFMFNVTTSFAEEASQAVKELAQSTLAGYGSDPVIVNAVKKQNSMGKTLDEIKATDKKWQDTAGIDSFMKSTMDSECGRHLSSLLESTNYLAEIFVMDNQGANVAMTGKTSDYWQGDEAKFQKSFADGNGAVFVDEVKFDDSSQAYLVQISVPVMDAGKAIGAITFGVDVEAVK